MSSQTDAQENRPAGVAPAIVTMAAWRVAAITVLPGYRIGLSFNDGAKGTVDLSRLVGSPDAGMYATLRDSEYFDLAKLELGAVTWPNGVDLDPCWLHDEIKVSPSVVL